MKFFNVIEQRVSTKTKTFITGYKVTIDGVEVAHYRPINNGQWVLFLALSGWMTRTTHFFDTADQCLTYFESQLKGTVQ